MARSRCPTLLDLIQAVSEVAASEQEMLATVADLINSGQVRLCGESAGASIDLSATMVLEVSTDVRQSVGVLVSALQRRTQRAERTAGSLSSHDFFQFPHFARLFRLLLREPLIPIANDLGQGIVEVMAPPCS